MASNLRDMEFEVVIVCNMTESAEEAKTLNNRLMSLRVVSTITDPCTTSQSDFEHLIKTSTVNVILASARFGTNMYTSRYSTAGDMLEVLCAEAQHFVIVQMCNDFVDAEVGSVLRQIGVFSHWQRGETMPDLLPIRLLDLIRAQGGRSESEILLAEPLLNGETIPPVGSDDPVEMAQVVSTSRFKVFSNGDSYSGQFSEGKRHGYGIYVFSHRNTGFSPEKIRRKRLPAVYLGYFQFGSQQGYGEMFYTNGVRFAGEWNKGRPHGYGTLRCADSVSYGRFKNGKREGWCHTYYPLRHTYKYSGDYQNDKKNGYGEAYCLCGGWYKGEWKNGRRDGQGMLYSASENEQYNVEYRKGKLPYELPH